MKVVGITVETVRPVGVHVRTSHVDDPLDLKTVTPNTVKPSTCKFESSATLGPSGTAPDAI